MSAPRLPYAVTLAIRCTAKDGSADLDIATFEYANLELARAFFHDCCTDPDTLSVTLDGPDEEPMAEYERGVAPAPVLAAWMLTIEHNAGHDASLHTTQAGARARLLDYVHQWWDRRVSDEAGKPMPIPADPDEAIDLYFDAEGNDEEYWFIEECRIHNTHPNPEN